MLLLLAFALIALGLAVKFPDRAMRLLRWIDGGRQVVFGLFAIVSAIVFLGTGNLILILIGGAIVIVLVWTGYFEWFDNGGN